MFLDKARGKDWLRARDITCALQTHFSSLCIEGLSPGVYFCKDLQNFIFKLFHNAL